MPRQRHGGSFAAAAGQDRPSGTAWETDSGEPKTAGCDTGAPSRRAVLRGAAGAGAASVAATALAGFGGAALAAPARGRGADRPAGPQARADEAEQLVVHLKDAKAGHIDIFRGTSLIRLRDPELAARLVRASRG